MKNKDLFNGLNNLDDDIIREVMDAENSSLKEKNISKFEITSRKRKWSKIIRTAQALVTAAAIIAVVILGNQVIDLKRIIRNYEKNGIGDIALNKPNLETSSNNDQYSVIDGYEKLYDSVKTATDYQERSNGVDGEELEKVEDMSAESEDTTDGVSTGITSDYSKTNVVTEGVDESDIVKTDGNYIYMVESGQISITDITKGKPGEKKILKPDFASSSDVINEIYVADNKLVIITSHDKEGNKVEDNYVYWSGGTGETITYSYDITDPKNPKLIGKNIQDGNYDSSRKIDGTVYVFTKKNIELPNSDKKDALGQDGLEKWVPKVNGEIIAADKIFCGEDCFAGLLIASFDVTKPDKTIDSKLIMSGNGEMYVSNKNIYIYDFEYSNSRTLTHISKVSFDEGKFELKDSTSVSGRILDTFAIWEKEDNLYVLSTDDYSEVSVNSLYVFNSDMNEIGKINEVARGEQIYAARNVGDLVYFITYKNTDPLFIADISNPKEPKILGNLEVEGYSDYLHYWDKDHVLGLGFIEGNGNSKIKVTMFDVSNPSKPKVENSKILDMDNYSDAIQGEYRGILVDTKKKLIGFPVERMDKNYNEEAYYELLKYDSKKGFALKKSTKLKYNGTSGYRGLYSRNNFYVAGNSTISYFKMK